jgi:hypothetical protein
VHQSGLACGVSVNRADAVVRHFGAAIRESLTNALPLGLSPLPPFNIVTWNRSQDGIGYITAHRDPPTVGGAIAIVTLWGRAVFRVWNEQQPTEWITGDGDLVIIRGNGWPNEDSVCPIHEAESPIEGDRMIMTLRYNKGGPDADCFN